MPEPPRVLTRSVYFATARRPKGPWQLNISVQSLQSGLLRTVPHHSRHRPDVPGRG